MASIQALISGAPSEEEQARALADSLRGSRRNASALALSTVAPVAGIGSKGIEQANQSAKRAGTLREAAQRRQQQQSQFDERMAFDKQQAEQNRLLKKSLAELKGGGAAGSKVSGLSAEQQTAFNNMPSAAKEKYRLSVAVTDKIPAVIDKIRNAPDAFGFGSQPTEYLPEMTPRFITEPLKDKKAASFTPPQRDARNAVYREAYQTIKELAGTAVSKHEKGRIEAFLPSPNDDADVVADKMRGALDYAQNNLESFRVYGLESPQAQQQPPVSGDDGYAPEGVDPDEWAALSEDDKAYFLEYMK